MKSTLASAAGYLADIQNSDGSWGAGDPLVCARAVFALRVQGCQEAVIDRGIAYLEACQERDGRFPAKTQMYTDAASTAYTLTVLNHFHYSKASIPVSRGLLWLLEHQHEDGSWSGRNSTKNAYTTSLCLRALHTYYLSGLTKFRNGVAHVQQKIAGPGFFDEPVSHVYAPVLNLQRIGYLAPDVQEAFLGFARKHAGLSVGAGETADVAYLCGTLGAIGEQEIRKECADYLEQAQNSDGGFGKAKGQESGPNWTALAMLALEDRL